MTPDSTLFRLLQEVSDGDWHSGEELGVLLGVSRAAVAKHVKSLAELGLHIEVLKGTGYRLMAPLELLDAEVILAEAAPALTASASLRTHIDIESTNGDLMSLWRQQGSVHGVASLAESQSAGRGRRGRQWHSPFARNLYISFGWHFTGGVAVLEGLSLAVGVVVSRALEACGVSGVGLKWPNDILIEGRKAGGILIELGGDAVSETVAVIGVGLNVDMPADQAIDQPWINVRDAGLAVSRSVLAGRILREMQALCEGYAQCGFSGYRDEWIAKDAFAGQEVVVHRGSEVINGVARGVDAHGELQLEQPEGVRTFVGGEVSLRMRR